MRFHSKPSRRDGPFLVLKTRKKPGIPGFFSYLHHFWQVNLAGAEGLGLGCRLGRFAAERHWRSLTPRHALRGAQPCLVAYSLSALTKNREASIVLASLFLAGAEGLEPSARGFGVDVGEHTGERERGDVSRSQPQARKRVVLVWCCEKNFRGKTGKNGWENRPRYPQNLRKSKQRKGKTLQQLL